MKDYIPNEEETKRSKVQDKREEQARPPESNHENEDNKFQDWIHTTYGHLPLVNETCLKTKENGASFRCFQNNNDTICLARISKLRSSSFGWIEICKHATINNNGYLILSNEKVSVKVFDLEIVYQKFNKEKNPLTTELLMQEKLIKLNHMNINTLITAFRSLTKVFLVYPIFETGDLFDYLIVQSENRLNENQARKIIHDALVALLICHQNHISHCDVSLENFLLIGNEGTVLIDFGVSQKMDNNYMIEHCGPIGKMKYLAPELLNSIDRYVDGRKIDVFSLGVVIFILVTGFEPWECTNEMDRGFQQICMEKKLKEIISQNKLEISECLIDLLHGMLAIDPLERFTVDNCLGHEWFRIPT